MSKVTRGSGQRRHESWPLHAPTFSPRALVHVSRLCRYERRVSGGPQEPPPQGEMRVEKLQCSCVPGLWAARGGQLLLPELPAPTPTHPHPAGAEAARPQGSFQTPKPVRWSRPVSPTGNWAEEEVETRGIGAQGPPCRPLSSCHAGDQRSTAQGENEQKPTLPGPSLGRGTGVPGAGTQALRKAVASARRKEVRPSAQPRRCLHPPAWLGRALVA